MGTPARVSELKIRQDLETGGHRWHQATGQWLHVLLEHTVLAEPQTQPLLLGFYVDVTGPH